MAPGASRRPFAWPGSRSTSLAPASPEAAGHMSRGGNWAPYHKLDSPRRLGCPARRSSQDLRALQSRPSASARAPKPLIFPFFLMRSRDRACNIAQVSHRVKQSQFRCCATPADLRWRERTAAPTRAGGRFGAQTVQPWWEGVRQRSAAHPVRCDIPSVPTAASASRSRPPPANPVAADRASYAVTSRPYRTRDRIWCHFRAPTASSDRQPTRHQRPQRQA
jgi:hypothetical protein